MGLLVPHLIGLIYNLTIPSIIGLVTYLIWYCYWVKHQPKEYKKVKPVDISSVKNPIKINYNIKKVPDNLDVIVVGSGIGGLSTAGYLARLGKKVLVLEQHDVVGGSTHSFVEKGHEFDTGIHYVGNVDKINKILDPICETPLEWDKLGREDERFVYDEIYLGQEKFEFRAGKENFINDLIKEFPTEGEFIRKYVDLCQIVSKKDSFFMMKILKPRWLRHLILKWTSSEYVKYCNMTVSDVLAGMTKNKQLISVLTAQFGDHGLTPDNASFFMHASVVNHYLNGGWYPRGGCSQIAHQIVPTILKAGGQVLINAPVKEILVEDNQVLGVEMMNKDKIFASQVVSGVGLFNTFQTLVSGEHQEFEPLADITQYDSYIASCTMIYLFLGIDGTKEELKIRSSNIWSLPVEAPDYSHDKMIDKFMTDKDPVPIFLGFPSAKDSTYESRFPGKTSAVVLTFAKWDWFKEWKDTTKKDRITENTYLQLKEEWQNKILNEVIKYYPQLADKITVNMVGSPLTFNHYIGSNFGEVYGMSVTGRRLTNKDITPRSTINGLFLTGQDITTLGFTGALASGILTASDMVGYGTLLDVFAKRNIVSDLSNV